ncbi:ABC transporter substrate-binding protein [uncultured Arthrobacter sp.]|uniref:ABC transporter substrate-binding protein n=1 Tax=uncultured Arthrobacter sp. TaxID=114050 RepID=UPI0025E6C721|nr:ABC transporter substrate-binding protein [uncultured Arthrobacter sp.]
MHVIHQRLPKTVLLPVIASALLLSGCSGGTTTGAADSGQSIADVAEEDLQGTTIEFSHFFGECSDEVGDSTDITAVVGECPTITTLTNKFNAENEHGITVNRLGGAAWDNYYDQLNTAIAGSTPPDVAAMHGASLVDYAQRSLLVPLDEAVAATDTDLEDALPVEQDAIRYEDKVYAVPFDVHAALAHVNVDLFRQAGLVDDTGAPVLPTSTEEFITAAKTMKDKTGKNLIAIPRVGDNLGWHLVHSLIMQQGSSVLSEDLTEANLDTPEARKAVDFVSSLFTSGYADGDQTYDAAGQSFLNGEAAMLYNGTWVVDSYNAEASFEYQATNFPTLFKEPAVWSNQHLWAIPAQKDADPVKYRAALEFVNFLYENDATWALGTGHISSRTSIVESPEYEAAPQRQNYAETGLTNAGLLPHISNWPAVEKICVQAVESIWFQDAPVEDALREADANINSALAGG